MATVVEIVGAKQPGNVKAKGHSKEEGQGQKNGALDVATDVEEVGVKRPGNVRAKGYEAGTNIWQP